MNINLNSNYGIYGWSIGTNAKAKYFTAKEQNKEDIYLALREIVDSYKYGIVAQFSTHVSCKDNPKMNGIHDVSLYFNRKGDTFFEMGWYLHVRKLLNKDSKKYRAVTQDLFEAIVSTREFKQFAQKTTKNIQECFKDVIEPLYKGELGISNDELNWDVRKAVNNFMKLKRKIVSSSTLILSRPELENT